MEETLGAESFSRMYYIRLGAVTLGVCVDTRVADNWNSLSSPPLYLFIPYIIFCKGDYCATSL